MLESADNVSARCYDLLYQGLKMLLAIATYSRDICKRIAIENDSHSYRIRKGTSWHTIEYVGNDEAPRYAIK